MLGTLSAFFKAGRAALDTWNAERGKAAAKENVQLGMEIARAKDNKAAAKSAMKVAKIMAEQADDEAIDDLALHLAGIRDKRVRGS